jgi:hypothetical protein
MKKTLFVIVALFSILQEVRAAEPVGTTGTGEQDVWGSVTPAALDCAVASSKVLPNESGRSANPASSKSGSGKSSRAK